MKRVIVDSENEAKAELSPELLEEREIVRKSKAIMVTCLHTVLVRAASDKLVCAVCDKTYGDVSTRINAPPF